MRNLSYQKLQYFTHQHTGQKRKVLFEGCNLPTGQAGKNDMMEGFTDNYIKIIAPYKAEWVNNIIEWRI